MLKFTDVQSSARSAVSMAFFDLHFKCPPRGDLADDRSALSFFKTKLARPHFQVIAVALILLFFSWRKEYFRGMRVISAVVPRDWLELSFLVARGFSWALRDLFGGKSFCGEASRSNTNNWNCYKIAISIYNANYTYICVCIYGNMVIYTYGNFKQFLL